MPNPTKDNEDLQYQPRQKGYSYSKTKSNKFYTPLLAVAVLVILVAILILLNYFNVISLGFLPHRKLAQSSSNANINRNALSGNNGTYKLPSTIPHIQNQATPDQIQKFGTYINNAASFPLDPKKPNIIESKAVISGYDNKNNLIQLVTPDGIFNFSIDNKSILQSLPKVPNITSKTAFLMKVNVYRTFSDFIQNTGMGQIVRVIYSASNSANFVITELDALPDGKIATN